MEKRRHTGRLLLFGALWLLVMGFIFAMSAEDGEESSALSNGFLLLLFQWLLPLLPEDTAGFVIRKAAHMFEYCCLALVSLRFAAELLWERRERLKPALLLAAGWSFFYACTDEWHQCFVPGRSGQFKDVLIDFSGALIGLLLAVLLLRVWKSRKHA